MISNLKDTSFSLIFFSTHLITLVSHFARKTLFTVIYNHNLYRLSVSEQERESERVRFESKLIQVMVHLVIKHTIRPFMCMTLPSHCDRNCLIAFLLLILSYLHSLSLSLCVVAFLSIRSHSDTFFFIFAVWKKKRLKNLRGMHKKRCDWMTLFQCIGNVNTKEYRNAYSFYWLASHVTFSC
jgi:hypothetical protein